MLTKLLCPLLITLLGNHNAFYFFQVIKDTKKVSHFTNRYCMVIILTFYCNLKCSIIILILPVHIYLMPLA